ncbi:uncharacterized protein LOC127732878 isoform X2 [Mytilus californianus]|uniref:uncharacterized protein LOC127732878 isoform X2 n=1 Tax=Mytilus californianus TaxID=6549 RepID=UPI00224872C7|nr:uncharacterized protein LOC127732878 isoform X2 [Mytilus californianus]
MYTFDYLDIRPLHKEDIHDAFVLEKEGYPEDEAATHAKLTYRHTEAPELNRGCFHGDELIGFVSATRYHEDTLKDEAMNMHIPNGESVCIHSVCVKESRRRQGVATHMLKEFINYVKNEEKDAHRILLICKSKLIPLYTRAGFIFKCKSDVVHGKETWYELEVQLMSRENCKELTSNGY